LRYIEGRIVVVHGSVTRLEGLLDLLEIFGERRHNPLETKRFSLYCIRGRPGKSRKRNILDPAHPPKRNKKET